MEKQYFDIDNLPCKYVNCMLESLRDIGVSVLENEVFEYDRYTLSENPFEYDTLFLKISADGKYINLELTLIIDNKIHNELRGQIYDVGKQDFVEEELFTFDSVICEISADIKDLYELPMSSLELDYFVKKLYRDIDFEEGYQIFLNESFMEDVDTFNQSLEREKEIIARLERLLGAKKGEIEDEIFRQRKYKSQYFV